MDKGKLLSNIVHKIELVTLVDHGPKSIHLLHDFGLDLVEGVVGL